MEIATAVTAEGFSLNYGYGSMGLGGYLLKDGVSDKPKIIIMFIPDLKFQKLIIKIEPII